MAANEHSNDSHARWPTTTIWDLIRDLPSPESREKAATELAARYWRPVYAYLRRRGRDHHKSSDLTQDFFLALLSREWIRRADERKGKFRVFLVTLLLRHIGDLEKRRQTRFERDISRLPVDMAESDGELLDWQETASAEQAFWLQYVRDLLDRSMDRFREETTEPDDPGARIFMDRLERGIEGRSAAWDELAAPHGLTVDQARWAYRRAAGRFRRILALQLGAEGERESDFQWAVAEMFQIVGRNRN